MDLTVNNAQIVQTNLRPENNKIIGIIAIALIVNEQQASGVLSLDITPEYLDTILKIIGVGTWEQLINTYIRVKINKDLVISGIGNIMTDQWLDVESNQSSESPVEK